MNDAPMAIAYFDMADRLRYWNRPYVDLNYRIKPSIREGVYFSDLLAELIDEGQIVIPDGKTSAWISHRLEQRKLGGIDFRRISDGRTFLCQEHHDEIGGTLGIWIDVSHLFETEHLNILEGAIGSHHVEFCDPGCQNALREHLHTVYGALELLRTTNQTPENRLLVDHGLEAAEAMSLSLDFARERAKPDARPLMPTS